MFFHIVQCAVYNPVGSHTTETPIAFSDCIIQKWQEGLAPCEHSVDKQKTAAPRNSLTNEDGKTHLICPESATKTPQVTWEHHTRREGLLLRFRVRNEETYKENSNPESLSTANVDNFCLSSLLVTALLL